MVAHEIRQRAREIFHSREPFPATILFKLARLRTSSHNDGETTSGCPTEFKSQRNWGDKHMIGSLMMSVSVLILLVGMLAGIAMGIQQDFALAPAHAHLNLVGGVMLFLFGLYYRLVPAAGNSVLAKLQGWLHIVGAILFPAGVAIVILNGAAFIAVPLVGSLFALAATALFAVIVLRTSYA
jgi:hypothetical protein